MAIEEENHLIKDRIDKIQKLRDLGVSAYPYSFDKTHMAADIVKKYEVLNPEEKSDDHVSVAGRIMTLRKMGKATFMHIQDESGKVQLYVRSDDIGADKYDVVRLLDMGDIVGAKGHIFKTKTGEVTVYVQSLDILCKSLRPLPEKYHGLKDDEIRFRHRELDMIMNPEVKDVFRKRAMIIRHIRNFLESRGFLELNTPILQTQYGGANARPFVTKINAWDMPMYLKISPELYLKRLLVGGFEKVYDMNYNFRNEGVDKTHNPEFFMIEYYWAYADREKIIQLTEELWEYVAILVNGSPDFEYAGKKISLKRPWKRIKMIDALKEFAGIDFASLEDADVKDLLNGYNIDYDEYNRGTAMSLLFEELVEDKLVGPVHILDHPIESTPLCKQTKYDPKLVERTEFYVNGWECGNGYSELNDPILQRQLLEEQAMQLRAGAQEAQPMDENFVQAIERGMPPAGGLGFGVDRMIMLLTGAESIREVIPFPIMKPAGPEKSVDQQNKEAVDEMKDSLKVR